jgi:hypothetical protein
MHEFGRRRGEGGRDSATVNAAARRSRIVACCHILPHTHVQRLLAGSPEEVSEECCLGEVCSHVAGVEIEVVYTTGTPHTRVLVVSGEETGVSRIVSDVPSRSHMHPAPVSDHGREQDRPAGEEWHPRIVWTDQAMKKV